MRQFIIRCTAILLISIMATACNPQTQTQGPTTWIDRPLDGDQVPLGPVTLQAHASDATGVTRFDFSIDNTPLAVVPGSGSRFSEARAGWLPSAPGTYTLRVRSANGNGNVGEDATARIVVGPSATVTIIPTPVPTACPGPPVITSFTASPSAVSYGQSITLTWGTITNADDAIIDAVGHISLKGGTWPLQPPPIASTYPTTTTTFVLTAIGCGGTTKQQATVTITGGSSSSTGICNAPPMVASFIANPGTINAGQSTTLSWGDISQASFAGIDQGIGEIPVSFSKGPPGSITISPLTTTTYTLTATGCGGTTTLPVTVVVNQPPPQPVCPGPPIIASFTANPTTITYGQTINFSWGAITNADDAVIDVVGHISLQGGSWPLQPPPVSATYPKTTTTFTLTAAGCGGTTTKQVTVVVNQPPPPPPVCPGPPVISSFSANPSTITAGQSTTLSWGGVTNATSAVIDPGIGGVATPGSQSVKPGSTTTFTLTATGCGGTTRRQVTVVVNSAPPPSSSSSSSSLPPPPPVDTTPPSISNVSVNQTMISQAGCGSTTKTTVSATVTDTSGVDHVVARLSGVGGGDVPMSSAGGNSYRADLGPFNTAGQVIVRVVAWDKAGNIAQSGSLNVSVVCIK